MAEAVRPRCGPSTPAKTAAGPAFPATSRRSDGERVRARARGRGSQCGVEHGANACASRRHENETVASFARNPNVAGGRGRHRGGRGDDGHRRRRGVDERGSSSPRRAWRLDGHRRRRGVDERGRRRSGACRGLLLCLRGGRVASLGVDGRRCVRGRGSRGPWEGASPARAARSLAAPAPAAELSFAAVVVAASAVDAAVPRDGARAVVERTIAPPLASGVVPRHEGAPPPRPTSAAATSAAVAGAARPRAGRARPLRRRAAPDQYPPRSSSSSVPLPPPPRRPNGEEARGSAATPLACPRGPPGSARSLRGGRASPRARRP